MGPMRWPSVAEQVLPLVARQKTWPQELQPFFAIMQNATFRSGSTKSPSKKSFWFLYELYEMLSAPGVGSIRCMPCMNCALLKGLSLGRQDGASAASGGAPWVRRATADRKAHERA